MLCPGTAVVPWFPIIGARPGLVWPVLARGQAPSAVPARGRGRGPGTPRPLARDREESSAAGFFPAAKLLWWGRCPGKAPGVRANASSFTRPKEINTPKFRNYSHEWHLSEWLSPNGIAPRRGNHCYHREHKFSLSLHKVVSSPSGFSSSPFLIHSSVFGLVTTGSLVTAPRRAPAS